MKTPLCMSLVAAIALLGASPALAISVAEAKSRCIVGEQADGYLGFASEGEADDALRREVRSINQQRRAAYEDLARRNGVTVEVTATLTAEKLINQAPAGQCVRDQSGRWIKK